jgi:GNAT superfamily N-acetyltransferase
VTSERHAVVIRPARAEDSENLREIERSAGARFEEIGMGWVASHEPISADELNAFAEAGRSWVAVDENEDAHPIGYAVAEIVDCCGHIEQVSVALEDQGQGVGRALVQAVEAWAVRNRLRALTLTTFSDVAWNRPLYEHLGFSVLAPHELSPGLVSIRAAEAKRGLDPATRVCMRMLISPAS